MSFIAFDARAPQIGRLAKGFGLALARFAAALLVVVLRKARGHRLEVALFTGLGTALAVAYLLFAVDPPAAPEPFRPAPAPTWVEVSKPLPMFDFVAPEFAHSPSTYRMRRHSAGGGRRDILTFGAFAGEGPWLRLEIHQVGGEGAPDQTFFVDAARRASEAGLALDGLGVAAALATRFGPAEWADARLSVPSDNVARENCAAFRFGADKPDLRILGLACGADGVPFSRGQLACLIGRLDLTAARGDLDLQKYFARSELARDAACPPARARAEGAHRPARHRALRRSASAR